MTNIKYRVKFQVNLNKKELRDFKLNLIESNYILEFDSDEIPRLPNKSESIRIGDRVFKMEDYLYVQSKKTQKSLASVMNLLNILLKNSKKV